MIDLGTITDLIKGRDIIAVCDNTFCSPWVQKPLNHGFDIVMHSATKYIGGHSDVVAGIAVISKERSDLSERLNYLLNASGAIAGPFDSFLLLRSLKDPAAQIAYKNSNFEFLQRVASGQTAAKHLAR